MFKLLGAVLLVVGGTGFSFCICKDLNSRLIFLREVRYMYELIQSEIRYTSLPLPQIFKNISDKIRDPFGSLLKRVGDGMEPGKGGVLGEVWRQEAEKSLSEVPFTNKQKDFLLRFPESMGLLDSKGQAKALQRRMDELDGWIARQEREGKEQNRVIMSAGIAGGVLFAILLL